MIVDKQLSVSNRKKSDIVVELRKKEFRPFPKVSKAKDSGETEDVVEDEEEVHGSDSDYDYLLGMAIWSLTKEKVRVSFLLPIRINAHASVRLRNFVNKLWRRRQSFLHYLGALRLRYGTKTLTTSSCSGRYVCCREFCGAFGISYVARRLVNYGRTEQTPRPRRGNVDKPPL
jgi:DNA topoisomerase-2